MLDDIRVPLPPPSMDDQPQAPPHGEFVPDEPNGTSAQYVGGFFPNSRRFAISGGAFTSVTNYVTHTNTLSVTPDFRQIPLGDLDLRLEVSGKYGVVNLRRGGNTARRRLYSARVHGVPSDLSAVVYQGRTAQEEWCRDIERYSGIRHPTFAQLFGVVNAHNVHATVFHDDLIPLDDQRYSGSLLSYVYASAYEGIELWEALTYFYNNSGIWLRFREYPDPGRDCTLWARRSSGQLCIMISPTVSGVEVPYYGIWTHINKNPIPPGVLGPEAASFILSALTLQEVHETFWGALSAYFMHPIPKYGSVRLGSLVCGDLVHKPEIQVDAQETFQIDDPVEVAYAPSPRVFNDFGWRAYGAKLLKPKLVENGWSRFASSELTRKPEIRRIIYLDGSFHRWFAQANHIFSRLGITHCQDDYAFMDCVFYKLSYLTTEDVLPEGYLFLCPLEDLLTRDSTQFRSPECAAYWSLDPAGSKGLDADEERIHGFPSLELQANAHGQSWSEPVYDALREFHRRKGFNPDSPDVALDLGHPLFQLTVEGETLFPHRKCSEQRDSKTSISP
ncbi:hypothetical protein C8R47DRAFT_814242 [Mycena vitilis]|nr:hypothetical protein C8R47DRAFT_814242 [Mycena vitilis]